MSLAAGYLRTLLLVMSSFGCASHPCDVPSAPACELRSLYLAGPWPAAASDTGVAACRLIGTNSAPRGSVGPETVPSERCSAFAVDRLPKSHHRRVGTSDSEGIAATLPAVKLATVLVSWGCLGCCCLSRLTAKGCTEMMLECCRQSSSSRTSQCEPRDRVLRDDRLPDVSGGSCRTARSSMCMMTCGLCLLTEQLLQKKHRRGLVTPACIRQNAITCAATQGPSHGSDRETKRGKNIQQLGQGGVH